MVISVPIYRIDDLTIINTSLYRSTSFILNIILFIVACIFIFCFLRFIDHGNQTSSIKTGTSLPTVHQLKDIKTIPHKNSYYDFEPYMVNNTFIPQNKTRRRFFYIDLGCFDGRDIDYFIHFHSAEISNLGNLSIIAFEPDPINLSACKTTQKRQTFAKGTVYDAAVWTSNGKVRYATEKGQKSRIDEDSALYVRSIDFSKWVLENFHMDDYLYIKFTIEGAEIPILEKMILDESLTLVDHLEVEWNEGLSYDLEPRRAFLECMFDNFGMDFLYMINPVDLRHGFNLKEIYASVPKDRTW
jgi:FkbM family methyltransferase